MFTEFLLNTGNFVVHVLSAFSAFLMGWLFIDVYVSSPSNKSTLVKGIGLFFIALFLMFGEIGDFVLNYFSMMENSMIFGLLLLFIGFFSEYTPFAEELEGSAKKTKGKKQRTKIINIIKISIIAVVAIAGLIIITLNFTNYPILISQFNKIIILSLIVLNILSIGTKYIFAIQKQLKNLFIGMIFFAISYAAIVVSKNVMMGDFRFIQWTQIYGILWWVEKISLIIGFGIIGKYAFYYLKYRLKAKFFISFIFSSLIIFFVITVAFLAVLINDFQNNTLKNLKASNKAIQLSLVDVRNRSILSAKALINNEQIQSGVSTEKRELLIDSVEDILVSGNADFIIVTNEAALSLYETQNKEAFGRSYGTDQFIKRASEGLSTNTVVVEKGILAPQIVVKTYIPVVRKGGFIGVVIVGNIIDNQFVDGIKKQTGLDVTIFAGEVIAATTFTTKDGLVRLSGTMEKNQKIIETVLKEGKDYEGITEVFNEEHLGIYTPLKDSDGKTLGMVFIGEKSAIIAAVIRISIQKTFALASLLILLALIPIYFFSKNLAKEELV